MDFIKSLSVRTILYYGYHGEDAVNQLGVTKPRNIIIAKAENRENPGALLQVSGINVAPSRKAFVSTAP